MASGDQIAFWWASDNHPLASGAATPDTRNGHPVYEFDPGSDEEAWFESICPSYYSNGGIKVRLFVGCDTATSGTMRFQSDFERITAGSLDVDADSFSGTFQSGSMAAPGTAGIFNWLEINHTNAQIDSVTAGDLFRLKVRRDADDTSGTDNVSGDVQLMAVQLVEI